MLLSMTGFGNAVQQTESVTVSVELKAVNNRYLKVSMRLPDFAAVFEPEIEKLVREDIARGSVQLSFHIRLQAETGGYRIDQNALSQYIRQLSELDTQLPDNTPPTLADLLSLPGVVTESAVTPELAEAVWPVVQSSLHEALQHFHEFRRKEGSSMLKDLQGQIDAISSQVDEVERHAPQVVSEYREKLLDRIRRGFEKAEVDIGEEDVLREVAVFADRCDINEEITRLRSHLEQFRHFLDSDRSMGRKLEFLGQEMFREINTIGSKANNVTIAHSVVEMKAAIERIREILQNVE